MKRFAARAARWLSCLAARAADWVEPPAIENRPEPDIGAQLAFAKAQCDRILLARALHDSLRRYSPREETAQA